MDYADKASVHRGRLHFSETGLPEHSRPVLPWAVAENFNATVAVTGRFRRQWLDLNVMRRRSLNIALLCLFTATVAAILAVTVTSDNPLNVTIVGAAETGTTKDVTVEFQRRNPVARFSEDDLRVQVRIAGAWQPPERFPRLECPDLLARTSCERVVFVVPRQTEACRFLLGYSRWPATTIAGVLLFLEARSEQAFS